jgi:CheY-like chemotaxis protein
MNATALRVLVVDDEPPIRKLLRMGLSTQGYEVLEASNGKASLQLLAREPDLIILDLGRVEDTAMVADVSSLWHQRIARAGDSRKIVAAQGLDAGTGLGAALGNRAGHPP